MNAPALKLVTPTTAEARLRQDLKRLDALRKELVQTEAVVAVGLRQLADERGVAFIRREQACQEFGVS